VRLLAILVMLAAVSDFAYSAYRAKDCFVPNPDPLAPSISPQVGLESGDCRAQIARRDMHMRGDGLAALVAIVLLVHASVTLSNARRSTRRLMMVFEVIGLLLAVLYSVLLVYAWE
jgi:hypothetical protein